MNIEIINEKVANIGFLNTANIMGIPLDTMLTILKSDYKTFKDLDFVPTEQFLDGIKSKFHFDNGYGVSVVRHKYSYGNKLGLYELAILNKDNDIVYNTPITNDVIGYLNKDDVSDYMIKVQRLVYE